MFLFYLENSNPLHDPLTFIFFLVLLFGAIGIPIMILAQVARAVDNAAKPKKQPEVRYVYLDADGNPTNPPQETKRVRRVLPLFYNADGSPIEYLKR